MNNNKGISTIIATILMILLVLVAAGVLWAIIQNLLSDQTEEINSGLDRITLYIVKDSVELNENNVTLIINRDIGPGKLSKIKILLYTSDGETYAEDVDASTLTELGSRKFTIDNGGLTNINKISIAPITESESGKGILKSIVNTYKIPS